MTDSERITALEARLAKAEARIAELEARVPLGMIGPVTYGPTPGAGIPVWPDTSGFPPPSWRLPTTCEPGAVIHCGPDGPVAIKPEKDNGERSGSASGPKPPLTVAQEAAIEMKMREGIREDAANGNVAYKRWLGTV